jgi:hypothetical protein
MGINGVCTLTVYDPTLWHAQTLNEVQYCI